MASPLKKSMRHNDENGSISATDAAAAAVAHGSIRVALITVII